MRTVTAYKSEDGLLFVNPLECLFHEYEESRELYHIIKRMVFLSEPKQETTFSISDLLCSYLNVPISHCDECKLRDDLTKINFIYFNMRTPEDYLKIIQILYHIANIASYENFKLPDKPVGWIMKLKDRYESDTYWFTSEDEKGD